MRETRNAVIVVYGRSGIGKAARGTLAHTYPSHFGAQVLEGRLSENS